MGKTCCHCKETKAISDFYKDKSQKDGITKTCKLCVGIGQRLWYQTHKEQQKARQIIYRRNNREKVLATQKRCNQRNKMEALTYYSLSNKPQCARCGICDIDILTIDHINGGGSRRQREKIEDSNLAAWLRRNNYPEGYQVLCANCNLKKKIIEYC